jgi:hypothetical protein
MPRWTFVAVAGFTLLAIVAVVLVPHRKAA